MTIKEGNELIEKLYKEIEQGKDVEFNYNWIRLLKESIQKAIPRGLEEAAEKLRTQELK